MDNSYFNANNSRMQEKVLLDVVPGSPLVDSLVQDCASESQKTFADVHRQEVFAIIDVIPSFASSQRDRENYFERLSLISISSHFAYSKYREW